MFWKSFFNGLSILLKWQVWLFIGVFGLIMHFYYDSFYMKIIKNPLGAYRKRNYYIIIKGLIESLFVTLTSVLMIPLLFGGSSLLPIYLLKILWLPIIILIAALAIVKIIGGFITKSSLENFDQNKAIAPLFMCVFTIIFFTHNLLNAVFYEFDYNDKIYPGFFQGLLFLLFSIISVFIPIIIIGFAVRILNEKLKNVISNILNASVAYIMGIIFMSTYCSYIVSGADKKIEIQSEDLSTDIKLSDSTNQKLDAINWNQRTSEDIMTATQLILVSNDTMYIDTIKMEVEKFSKKIYSYPQNEIEKIKNGVATFLRYNENAANDLNNYIRNLSDNKDLNFNYSGITNKEYDTLYNYYNLPMAKQIKDQGDSALNAINFKTFPATQLKYISEKSALKLDSTVVNYHLAFKNIFNEDYN